MTLNEHLGPPRLFRGCVTAPHLTGKHPGASVSRLLLTCPLQACCAVAFIPDIDSNSTRIDSSPSDRIGPDLTQRAVTCSIHCISTQLLLLLLPAFRILFNH